MGLDHIFCAGVDRILLSFCEMPEALALCAALAQWNKPMLLRFLRAVQEVCLARSLDYKGKVSELILHNRIEIDQQCFPPFADKSIFAWQQLQFEYVKMVLFSQRVGWNNVFRHSINVIRTWTVRRLEINSDYALPLWWPKGLQELRIRFCPKAQYQIACPLTVRALTVYSYSLPSYKQLRITRVPIELETLDIDDHCIDWEESFWCESALYQLTLRCYIRSMLKLPPGLRRLCLCINAQYKQYRDLLNLIYPLEHLEQLHLHFFIGGKVAFYVPDSLQYLKVVSSVYLELNIYNYKSIAQIRTGKHVRLVP